MKEPQENSPVVRAPKTRLGGGSRMLISATCAVISDCRKLRTWRSRSAASICEVPVRGSAVKAQLAPSNPQRINANGSAMWPPVGRPSEPRADLNTAHDEIVCVMASTCRQRSLGAGALRATTDLPTGNTVRKSTSHHWDACYIHDATPLVAFDPRLRQGSNNGQSANARCVPRLPGSLQRVRSLW